MTVFYNQKTVKKLLPAGQAINPMMYGMGMYMNPYYTGFYGGFGNMGHMNPLGYQISSGMAIPGMGGQQQQQNAGYGGGYGGGGYGAGSHLASSSLTLFFSGLTFLFSIKRLLTH